MGTKKLEASGHKIMAGMNSNHIKILFVIKIKVKVYATNKIKFLNFLSLPHTLMQIWSKWLKMRQFENSKQAPKNRLVNFGILLKNRTVNLSARSKENCQSDCKVYFQSLCIQCTFKTGKCSHLPENPASTQGTKNEIREKTRKNAQYIKCEHSIKKCTDNTKQVPN